jgi:hypothetical protein
MSISESRKRYIWLFMRKNFKIAKTFSRKLSASQFGCLEIQLTQQKSTKEKRIKAVQTFS